MQDSKGLWKVYFCSRARTARFIWVTQPQAAFWAHLVPEQKEDRVGVPSVRAKMPPGSFGCRTVGSGWGVGRCWLLTGAPLFPLPTTEASASSASSRAAGAALLPPPLRGQRGKLCTPVAAGGGGVVQNSGGQHRGEAKGSEYKGDHQFLGDSRKMRRGW